MNAESRAREQFEVVTAAHVMTVLHDEELYRHLRFQAPGTWVYGYDLVTWPGHLAINGDLISGYTFARVADMVDFFRSGPDINPGYWAEKITNQGARDGTRVYSEERLQSHVKQAAANLCDYLDFTAAEVLSAWNEHTEYVELHDESVARASLSDFEFRGHAFPDTWEWDLRDWDHGFLLCCFAIRAGVETYSADRKPIPA